MKKQSETIKTLKDARRLYTIGAPPLWTPLVIAASLILSAVVNALPPMFIGRMIDALQRGDSHGTIVQLLAYMAVVVVMGVLTLLTSLVTSIFREALARNTQLRLFDNLRTADFTSLMELTQGQITSRFTGDVRNVCSLLEYSLFPTISSVMMFAVTTVMLLRIDYRLGVIALAASLLIFIPLRLAKPHLTSLQWAASAKYDELYGVIEQANSYGGLLLLRNRHVGRARASLLSSVTKSIFDLRVRQMLVGGIAGLTTSLSGTIGPGVVMAAGAYLAMHHQITAGVIVSVLIYQSRLSGPLNALSQLQVTFVNLSVASQRLFQLIDLPRERSGDRAFEPGPVVFDDVALSFGGKRIVSDVRFTLEPGRAYAVLGPSGAGKSSLASMLTRLRQCERGAITISGADIQSISIDELRDRVAIVPQEPHVFDGSLLDNITVARPGAQDAAVEEAVAIARLRTVVDALPEGLATQIGERGSRLSGGEYQRVCLARALVQRPSVLILDEALSGVSVEMERAILADLRERMSGGILIVITHRSDSVRDFDAVIEVNDAKACLSPRRDVESYA